MNFIKVKIEKTKKYTKLSIMSNEKYNKAANKDLGVAIHFDSFANNLDLTELYYK